MFHRFLTAPEAFTQTATTYRYKVELVSTELELDRDGNAVPKYFKVIDLVVTKKSDEAIKTLIAATSWLDGFTMVSSWIPEDGCDCF